MLAWGYVEFNHPVDWQVTAIRRRIVGDIARDIGKLECYAKVARAIKRHLVVGRHPHNEGHRHADRTGNMIAIAQHVILAARPPIIGIKRKSGNNIIDDGARNSDLRQQITERVKSQIPRRFARKGRIGPTANYRQRGRRIMPGGHFAAMVLAIGQIVGGAAPGIEQPYILARFSVE